VKKTAKCSAEVVLISVCVCTYKRPQLKVCLDSIAQQNLPDNVIIRVVVVDNCPELSAKKIVETFTQSYSLDVVYLPLPAKNLSRIRNRCVSAATGEFIALIDDDEIASKNWIKHLVECANNCKADVVIGPVLNQYSETCPAWLAEADLMARLSPSTGKVIKTGHAGNALIRRSMLEKSAVIFDERLGISGGEDTDFFYRLYKSGAKIIGCFEAVAFEIIDPARENWDYLLMENKRIGQVFCRVIWPLLSLYERAVALFFILAKIAYFGAGFLGTWLFGKRFFAYWQLRCMCNIEKIRYLLRKNKTVAPYCA